MSNVCIGDNLFDSNKVAWEKVLKYCDRKFFDGKRRKIVTGRDVFPRCDEKFLNEVLIGTSTSLFKEVKGIYFGNINVVKELALYAFANYPPTLDYTQLFDDNILNLMKKTKAICGHYEFIGIFKSKSGHQTIVTAHSKYDARSKKTVLMVTNIHRKYEVALEDELNKLISNLEEEYPSLKIDSGKKEEDNVTAFVDRYSYRVNLYLQNKLYTDNYNAIHPVCEEKINNEKKAQVSVD